MSFPSFVKIVEVGPRDGLQAETKFVDTETKIELINRLSQTGLSVIEVTSFVSAKKMPQLADHATVFQQIEKKPNIHYPVLVPNVQGLEAALAVGVKEISIFTAASDKFTERNINCSIEQSFERYQPVVEMALKHKLRVRGYLSCVVECPYQGKTDPNVVTTLAQRLYDMGCYEISLGDTIGVATPLEAIRLFETVAKKLPINILAAHFHNTYGQALANLYAVLQLGVATIDSAVAGLGGCPYAVGATGNVATEDVLYLLEGLKIETGVNLDKVIDIGNFICEKMNRINSSKVALAHTKSLLNKNNLTKP